MQCGCLTQGGQGSRLWENGQSWSEAWMLWIGLGKSQVKSCPEEDSKYKGKPTDDLRPIEKKVRIHMVSVGLLCCCCFVFACLLFKAQGAHCSNKRWTCSLEMMETLMDQKENRIIRLLFSLSVSRIKSQITCSDSEFGEGKQSFIQTVKTVALLQNYQFTTYVTLYEVKAWHKTSSQGFLLPPFIWKVFRISWSFWFPIGYLKSCLPLGVKERPYQP